MPLTDPLFHRLRTAAPSLLAIALAGTIGACSSAIAPLPPPALSAPALSAAAGPSCRVAPDGGPPARPATPNTSTPSTATPSTATPNTPTPTQTADRGIGGTGAPTTLADRGIGGTGIVGVITGFASICLAGQEIGIDPSSPILIDGHSATAASLRAGQVAAVDATGPAASLRASRIVIHNEASGIVQSIEPDGTLRVAGQRVVATPATLGRPAPRPGEWVVVSGLRDPDGTILATRIDQRAEGDAVVHGPILWTGSTWRIGMLEVRPAPGQRPLHGTQVTAAGRYADGVLFADIIEPDAILPDPIIYFGPAAQLVIIETYAGITNGHLVLNRTRQGRGLDADHQIVEFERRYDGGLQPVSIRQMPPGAISRLNTAHASSKQSGARAGTSPSSRPDGPPN